MKQTQSDIALKVQNELKGERAMLKKPKKSSKFGVIFPANKPLKYWKGLSAVEHPNHENVWILVKDNEITIL